MKIKDVQTAARLRDVMRRVAKKEIDRAHPPDIFGHVSDIDELAGTAKITVEGSSEETSASYGFGDPPAIGEAVRVTGRSGSRYVVGTGTGTVTPIEEQVVDDGVAISGLDPATLPLTGDELVIVVQDGVTKRATTQDIADLATGGGTGFPVGPFVDVDGQSTTEIQVNYVDLGGGFWITVETNSVAGISSGPPEARDYFVAAVVDDELGGAQQISQREVAARTVSGVTEGKLNLAATTGAGGIGATAELTATGGAYLDEPVPPIPHVKLESGVTAPLGPGTSFGRILIESSGFGPIDIQVGTSTDLIGFFAVTPVVQPANPTTLSDVITALVDLGLVAP